ncbi:N-acetyl-alpha-D-glucosaminyl L-malate synthase BshA [bacterium]|nr:N-acetyl-alpha-D-glucosaminyl L-malate synthase BshA [bacterium]
MKIGITCYPTFGGSGVIATEVGMALARRGHEVHFICYEIPRRLDRFTENIFFHEVIVPDSPVFKYAPYSVALASKMVEVHQQETLDVLHVHYAVPHATSAFLAKQVIGEDAPKIVTTLHGTDITLVGKDKSYLPITRFSITESDRVTCPSEFLKEVTYKKLGIPETHEISVIPNFVNTDQFAPRHRTEESILRLIGEKRNILPLIIHASNFRKTKRIGDVIQIFARIQQKCDSYLVMIGDGPERSMGEALVDELQLRERVIFLGNQEHLSEILPYGNLFLLPSQHESFGLAALEALSCGVPVVASATEGIPEVVRHGEVGFLAKVGDIEAMSTFGIQIVSDTRCGQEFSLAARRHVERNFTEAPMIDRYEALYQDIAG